MAWTNCRIRSRFGRIGVAAVFLFKFIQLLVDGGIEEEGQEDRRRPVDRHGDAGIGGAEIKALVELFHILQGADADAAFADFPKDVRLFGRVFAIQGEGIEGGAQALGVIILGQVMKPGIGLLRRAFPGELPLGVFPFPAKLKDAGGIGEIAGQMLFPEPFQGFGQAVKIGQGDLGNLQTGERFAVRAWSG